MYLSTQAPNKHQTGKMFDVMQGIHVQQTVLGNGFVRLVDCMPRLIPTPEDSSPLRADSRIVEAARVSYSGAKSRVSTDEGLVRYLMRHQHTTPFEMVKFTFVIKMPLFIARQHFRHRTANINEISGRYSVLEDEFYVPRRVYKQSKQNNQGSSSELCDDDTQELFQQYLWDQMNGYRQYLSLVNTHDVSKETARIGLPQNIMTQFYWTIDLHNLFHYLHLRMDSHAQFEIREYANAIARLIRPVVPVAYKAFEDYTLNRVVLTGPETELFRDYLGKLKNTSQPETVPFKNISNKREQKEWEEKQSVIGIGQFVNGIQNPCSSEPFERM